MNPTEDIAEHLAAIAQYLQDIEGHAESLGMVEQSLSEFLQAIKAGNIADGLAEAIRAIPPAQVVVHVPKAEGPTVVVHREPTAKWTLTETDGLGKVLRKVTMERLSA